VIRRYKGTSPKIDASAFIEDSAQIIGDVEIGRDSSVWFNAVIRGDVNFIRIGERTNIQDGCVLHVTKDTHPLILANDITVGHAVTLHGCTIKDRCLIGMGAIVLDGAEVGEDSIIGAGALVKEGMRVEPGTLVVGVPARVARKLSDEEKARIKRSALNYINYSADYKAAID
jgi:carbonic anhydrase/acetyltransferase-like protein (isoleucine patch superfamily)